MDAVSTRSGPHPPRLCPERARDDALDHSRLGRRREDAAVAEEGEDDERPPDEQIDVIGRLRVRPVGVAPALGEPASDLPAADECSRTGTGSTATWPST